jgi:nucleotide-binding universal stress UspA family protein
MIVIGVDALGSSEDAVALARALAPATRADLLLVTVVHGLVADGSPTREGAWRILGRMSRLLESVGLARIRTVVVESGSAAEGLHRVAEAEGAALLIVGSSHAGGFGHVRPGATGTQLLMGGPCAVAIAPNGYRQRAPDPLRRIGAAYDGSAESKGAVRTAVAATRALGGALRVLTVNLPGAVAEVRQDLDATVAALPADVGARGTALVGHPYRKLAERSAELDLLFVGSRGYGPLHAVLLGGTSRPLLHRALCPVIVLPRGERDECAGLFAQPATAAA